MLNVPSKLHDLLLVESRAEQFTKTLIAVKVCITFFRRKCDYLETRVLTSDVILKELRAGTFTLKFAVKVSPQFGDLHPLDRCDDKCPSCQYVPYEPPSPIPRAHTEIPGRQGCDRENPDTLRPELRSFPDSIESIRKPAKITPPHMYTKPIGAVKHLKSQESDPYKPKYP